MPMRTPPTSAYIVPGFVGEAAVPALVDWLGAFDAFDVEFVGGVVAFFALCAHTRFPVTHDLSLIAIRDDLGIRNN